MPVLIQSARRLLLLVSMLAAPALVACGDSTTVNQDVEDDATDTIGAPDGAIADADGETGVEPVCTDADGDSYFADCGAELDCNDRNALVNPGAEERCGDRFDNNCDGQVDEGCACTNGDIEACYDGDATLRGVGRCVDGVRTCANSEWGPCSHGVPTEEQCDGLDNNCDANVDEGVSNACGSCGSAPLEICGDLLDNDCNGLVDDAEGCSCGGRTNQPCYSGPPGTLGFGICRGGVSECADDVFVACLGEVLPEVEICDGLDNDCDGQVDELLANRCGVCGAPDPFEVCDGVDNDCDGDVDERLVNVCGLCGPSGQEEVCGNGVDDDCDGDIDEGCGCGLGSDACWPGNPVLRGIGACADGTRTCDASGEFWGPCTAATLPSIEVCDGVDNDCDGVVDEGRDGCSVCGGDLEVCDGLDNDCDGQIDEGQRNACGQCFDSVATEETCGPLCCDGVDNDCDGLIDEGLVNVCGQCGLPCFVAAWGERPSDWNLGESEGLDVDASGGIRLGTSASLLPYLWVANSGEASVSRINTETLTEEARYPVGQSPSRTAVDFSGNVYIANRAFGGQGTVTRVDARDCTGDACVRFNAPVGPTDGVPRGIAVDADGYIWVGTYNDQHLRKIDPDTGLVIEAHYVGRRVYGIAIDSEGIIWFTALEIPQFTNGALGAFNTNTNELIGTWPVPGCSNPYGIAVDAFGSVWMGNFTCNSLVRFDRITATFSTYTTTGLDRTRGVAVDGDGFVWLASYGTDRVAKFDPRTLSFVGTYPVCDGPIGIGIANDGHVWVPCYSSDSVHRLAPDGTFAGSVAVGREPYSYSDLTGFQLRNFTARRGTWVVQFDCGFSDCTFPEAVWLADQPLETDVQLRARVSPDGTAWSPWAGPFITTPADLSGLPAGRYLEAEITLRTSRRELTPILQRFEVYWARP